MNKFDKLPKATQDEVLDKIRNLFPGAGVDVDFDGQIVIYTGIFDADILQRHIRDEEDSE